MSVSENKPETNIVVEDSQINSSVTPQITPPENPAKKKSRILLIFTSVSVLLLLIVTGLVGNWVYNKYVKRTAIVKTTKDRQETQEEQKVIEASSVFKGNNSTEGKEKFDRLIEQESDKDKKVLLYNQKAQLCASVNDYDCAIQSYDRIIEIIGVDQSATYVVAALQLSIAKNNKPDAQKYLDILKSIKASQTDKSVVGMLNSQIAQFEIEVNQL